MATPIPANRAKFTTAEIAAATGGALRGPNVEVCGVTSDSRAVRAGALFVALRGDTHDGHRFVETAIAAGAAAVVVERGTAVSGGAVIEVDDTLVAWGALAAAHLAKWRIEALDGRVVAITGSAGKTTTKELTAALLAAVGPTHYTPGNLNNRVGVPAVVFGLEATHRFCVLEMGMSLPGEIEKITAFAKPDVAVIVNVGLAHSEGVGGKEGVMHEKGAVYRALSRDGIAVVNADDEYVRRAAKGVAARRVETFGKGAAGRLSGIFTETNRESSPPSRPSSPASSGAHYRLVERTPEHFGSRVVLSCAGREVIVYLPLAGEAAAIDLCAAIATQEAASREVLAGEQIEAAIAKIALDGRGTIRVVRDILLIDDTYNANPSSMRAALGTLSELAGTRRKVAVLGEMLELGALAEEEHDKLGDAVADAGVTLLLGCGGLVGRTLARAGTRGVEVVRCKDADTAAEEAAARIRPGDAVLVKASRSVGAERVVARLSS